MTQSILIARITGAHGIRGAVKLTSFAATPADVAKYKPLLTSDGREFIIERMKPAHDEFIADLKDISDRNAAEALKGTELFVDRAHLPASAENEFYLADLIGKTVISGETPIGIVEGLQNFGAGELLELTGGNLVPVIFITSVAEKISVGLPDGFLDPPSREDKHH